MSLEQESLDKAAAFRREHDLGSAPIGDIITLAETALGVDVAVVSSPEEEHGLTFTDPVYNDTFILVAKTHHPMRQRSSIAHEMAHVIFADWQTTSHKPLNSERAPSEVRADAFARHLLAPLSGVKAFLKQHESFDWQQLSEVSQYFLVSPDLALIQVRGAKIITPAKYEEMKQQRSSADLARQFGWEAQYNQLSVASATERPPQQLLASAIVGYRHGLITAQELALISGESVDTVVKKFELLPRETYAPVDTTHLRFNGVSDQELDLLFTED